MEMKTYLQRAYILNEQINNKLREITAFKSQMIYRGISYSERVQSSPNLHILEDNAIKLIEMECDVNKMIDELINLTKEIERLINTLEDNQLRKVLSLRYIKFKSWSKIANEMKLSLRWVHRLHSRAIKQLKFE